MRKRPFILSLFIAIISFSKKFTPIIPKCPQMQLVITCHLAITNAMNWQRALNDVFFFRIAILIINRISSGFLYEKEMFLRVSSSSSFFDDKYDLWLAVQRYAVYHLHLVSHDKQRFFLLAVSAFAKKVSFMIYLRRG